MAIQTKAQLSASNNTAFPDNNTGDITPAILRGFNTASIDSYAALSGSNTFVGDQVVTGSLTVTGTIIGVVSGSLSNAATASYVRGATKYYQVSSETHGGLIVSVGLTVTGPNGENLATLQSQGWNFTTGGSQITVTRPSSSNASRPFVDIVTHGRNAGNVFTKSPTGTSTVTYTAVQTFNTSSLIYTELDVYGITPANAGYATSGTGSITLTFGEIQN